MNYEQAAQIARRRLYRGERGTKVRRATQRALDLAPPEHKGLWKRFLLALEPGHRLKVGTFPVEVYTFDDDDGDRELAAHIDRLLVNIEQGRQEDA